MAERPLRSVVSACFGYPERFALSVDTLGAEAGRDDKRARSAWGQGSGERSASDGSGGHLVDEVGRVRGFL